MELEKAKDLNYFELLEEKMEKEDHADVLIHPPFTYILPLVAGIVAHILAPFKIFSDSMFGHVSGWPLLTLGLLLVIWSMRTMLNAGEHFKVNEPTNKIVSHGPFSITRNPIYLSFNFVYLGIAFIVNTIWLIIFLPIAFITLHYGVILREEHYMKNKLGNEYLSYRKRVRRWI